MPVIECDLPEINRRVQAHRGHALVLHHFATWCGPCATEMPLFVELARDVAVVAVSWDLFMSANEDGMKTVQDFAAETHIDFDVLLYQGPPQELIDFFSIEQGTVPYTMVYDTEGKIVYRWDGVAEDEVLLHVRSLAQSRLGNSCEAGGR